MPHRKVNCPQEADIIQHGPRGTSYRVELHGIEIKDGDGWATGCVYLDTKTFQRYARPYHRFNVAHWTYYKVNDDA